MQEYLKANAADLIFKGFLPLLMVAGVLWGAYTIMVKQMDVMAAHNDVLTKALKGQMGDLNENINKLRRDVLRAHNPNATAPKE